MKKPFVAIGILLIVSGAFMGVYTYQVEETGASSLSVVSKGLVTKGLETHAQEQYGRDVNVIVAFDPISEPMTSKALSVKGQEIRSLAVRTLSTYGFTLSGQEAIPAFGLAVGKAPAENVGLLAQQSGVRAVVRDRFISIGGVEESSLLQTSHADFSEVNEFHEVDQLPEADNIVVSVVDSSAPKESYVENAVSVRGSKPYSGYWHGKAVAKTVNEVSPNSRVTVVKTLDEYGTGRLSTIVKGIEKAVTMKPKADIVNLSLGTDPSSFNVINIACETVVREYGVKVIASAGNTGAEGGYVTSPANSDATLSVGAITPNGDVASYSAKDYDTLAIGDINVNTDGVRGTSGTSFSAPVVSGMVARWSSNYGGDFGDIDVRGSISSSTELFKEEQSSDLPVLKGSDMSETEPKNKTSTTVETLPYFGVALAGVVVAVYGTDKYW